LREVQAMKKPKLDPISDHILDRLVKRGHLPHPQTAGSIRRRATQMALQGAALAVFERRIEMQSGKRFDETLDRSAYDIEQVLWRLSGEYAYRPAKKPTRAERKGGKR
jgi:hypothetical protein